MSDYRELYFRDGKDEQACRELDEWFERNMRPEVRAGLILVLPTRSAMLTLTKQPMNRWQRLKMIEAAAHAVSSSAPDSAHEGMLPERRGK